MMTKEELNKFFNNIEGITSSFELTTWTENVKLLKEDFDLNNINLPKDYLNVLDELSELSRQTRLLFVLSVLEKVCLEEDKIYKFDIPYQANMEYSGVFKKESTFYLVDEDGDFREVFTNENFVNFLDDQYFELYE